MTLKREDFSRERIDTLVKEMRSRGFFEAISHEDREKNRKDLLAHMPQGGDLWVFGYGSLIWNPAFRFVEKKPARLFGYHRSFCLHLTIGRGSPDAPGLMLALDRGGSCNGMAFRIAAKDIESETEILWMREMITGAYIAHWGNLYIEGQSVPGFTFVINRNHSRYVGGLNLEETADRLLNGKGNLGTCREYPENTVEHLARIEVKDLYLQQLCGLIRQKDSASRAT